MLCPAQKCSCVCVGNALQIPLIVINLNRGLGHIIGSHASKGTLLVPKPLGMHTFFYGSHVGRQYNVWYFSIFGGLGTQSVL